MIPPTDIDTLIAALHPHIAQYLFNDPLGAHSSLEPNQSSRKLSLSLLDAFAVLLAHHPGCESVAVTAQTHQPEHASLYICPSPSIPRGFHDNAKELLTLFSEMSKEYRAGGVLPHDGSFSESEKRFVLYTHHLCYPVMRERAISTGLDVWDNFIEATESNPGMKARRPIDEDEERLREELKDDLHRLSGLVQTFVDSVSRASVGTGKEEDEDVLRFHALCLTIRDVMKDAALETFLDEYIYLHGVDHILKNLRLPIAVSTLVAISRNPKLHLEEQCSIIVIDPFLGARKFSAIVTETYLEERFGGKLVRWEGVVRAFDQSVADVRAYHGELQWDARERVLSSPAPVITHPEVTLIQYLLENSEGESRGYIACSEMPCYASVLYAGAVNEALEARFTMRTDHPDWCRLYSAAPWILPEAAKKEVVDALKEELLQDLNWLVIEWHRL